jgi:hypothetical protein
VDFSKTPGLWEEVDGMNGLGACVYRDGVNDTKKRLNRLNEILVNENRYDELQRSFKDEVFQNELLEKYVPENADN